MTEMTCHQLRTVGAELALGILPGQERAEAIAHLDRCPGCRQHVERLTLVGDGLLGLVPGSEPPVGFETRVADRLSVPRPQRLRRRRLRLRIAAIAAAAAIACGFGGWAIGTAIDHAPASASRPAEPNRTFLEASLTAGHRPVGQIFAHPGSPGWVYMSVDLDRHSGKVTCQLEHVDGAPLSIGSFRLDDGYGYWGAPAPVDPATISGARLLAEDGSVLATANFAPQHRP
ncbi:hypothetical protein [Streptomyces sp. XD-27]|uniref:hypothetical protein n=1 Tax=Streptomyces sp. XD-27 TaxID=3062779 RepID=UPI0026F42C0A|nr:hypothetical protein [Streptomyces sp. XD-27]WKX69314.1 hypothetical protein Q3Y56_04690 [Streptomyces sp. XD-27]